MLYWRCQYSNGLKFIFRRLKADAIHAPEHNIRAFYFEGIDNWNLHRLTRTVPTLIHISPFLFFSGLPVLFHVNLTVFNVVLTWLGLCLGIYGCIMFMPVLFQDCPYSSPLSSTAWFFVTGTPYVAHRLLKRFTSRDHASSGGTAPAIQVGVSIGHLYTRCKQPSKTLLSDCRLTSTTVRCHGCSIL